MLFIRSSISACVHASATDLGLSTSSVINQSPKTIRIENASTNCAEIWHTTRWCSCAPVYEVSTHCSLAFGSYKQLLAELAILPPSSGIVIFVVSTSTRNNSASRQRRESSFGHKLRLIVLYTSTKNHLNHLNRSSTVVRGFAASRRPKQCTELQL